MLKLKGILVISAVFFSCQKNKMEEKNEEPLTNVALNNGLGVKSSKLNGYIFSSVFKSINGNFTYARFNFSAFFGDPARNLMLNFDHFNGNSAVLDAASLPNVSVGAITTMNQKVGAKNTTLYSYNQNIPINFEFTDFTIQSEGNGTFKPFNLLISRGFPRIHQTFLGDTISKGMDFVINKSEWFSNYDSILVSFYTTACNCYFVKRFDANDSILFTKEELNGLNDDYYTLYFMLFNYSNTTIEGKKYVFEQANKMSFPLVVTN